MINHNDLKRAGILFVLGTVFGILSVSNIVDSEQYLELSYLNNGNVVFSSIAQLIMSFLYLGFALYMLPLLKSFNKFLANMFFSANIISTVLQIIGVIILLLIIELSDLYILSDGNVSVIETIGTLLKRTRDIINHVLMMLVHCIAWGILFYIVFKEKITKRIVPVVGFVSLLILVSITFLVVFNQLSILSMSYILLSFPIMLIENTFSVLLIFSNKFIKFH